MPKLQAVSVTQAGHVAWAAGNTVAFPGCSSGSFQAGTNCVGSRGVSEKHSGVGAGVPAKRSCFPGKVPRSNISKSFCSHSFPAHSLQGLSVRLRRLCCEPGHPALLQLAASSPICASSPRLCARAVPRAEGGARLWGAWGGSPKGAEVGKGLPDDVLSASTRPLRPSLSEGDAGLPGAFL